MQNVFFCFSCWIWPEGDLWDPGWPICLVDHFSARAYADWYSRHRGQAWRLPKELEWEKAARGVDGRFYPWGDRIDASWTCNKQSFPERPLPSPIGRFPVDESPYGVLGMAGNMCDWTADIYEDEGPPVNGSLAGDSMHSSSPDHYRTIRGSSWVTSTSYFRLAQRFSWRASFGKGDVSFRLVRDFSA